MSHTHSDRLERWLGADAVGRLSFAMRNWYGPPIALHGVPGRVYAARGGDFVGAIEAGQECSAIDRALDLLTRNRRFGIARSRRQSGAFASLDAIAAAYTGGKGENAFFNKPGTAANAIGNCISLWKVAGLPAAGAAGAAAPGGTVPTNATTGSLQFANPTNANTTHFTTGYATASVVNTLLLYDRLFSVAKTMNSTATEAVTGVPTRYQSTTATNEDYIGANFVFPEVGTVLPATAHNWTVCQYTDQGGNTAQSIPSIAGISAGTANSVDLAAFNWFMPLAAGDSGIKNLTQMQCSALVATGTIDFVIGHPIAFMPCPIANIVCTLDGIYTAFNLTRIYDSACLSLLEMPKTATTATTYSGQVTMVAE
jgi:hypothetical protein